MFPVQLLPELREQIVSYLGVWEFNSFSLTCHQALQAVEAYSRRELDRIERKHNVDDTWRFRVGMQAAQDAVARLSSEGVRRLEGVMLVPNNVSHRRMLRSAYRTHLYSLGTARSCVGGGCHALAMHPNGRHLLSRHDSEGDDVPSIIGLWNLSTKQFIRSLGGHEHYGGGMGFSAGHIVTSSGKLSLSSEARAVRIWSMDGEYKDAIDVFEELPDGYGHSVLALAVSNEAVYAVDNGGPIYVINTMSRAVSSMDQPWGESRAVDPVDLRVCKNYLLHLRGNSVSWDPENEGTRIGVPRHDGLYVFDRDSMEVRSRLVGNYSRSHVVGNFSSLVCNSNGDVAIVDGGEVRVFQLRDDGNLVSRLTISLPMNPRQDTLLHMSNSRIFAAMVDWSSVRFRTRVEVYNALNGTMERRLSYPTTGLATGIEYIPDAMASNNGELLVGFHLGNEPDPRSDCTIKAYLC